MDLQQKIRTIPTEPGVYLYKNAEGEVIYVGKAKNLRSRVASYFHEGRVGDAKTGTLVREAVDVDYIVVANNKEALALENNLIKQKQASLQHPVARRQDLSLCEVDSRTSATRGFMSPAACARTAAPTMDPTSLPTSPTASLT